LSDSSTDSSSATARIGTKNDTIATRVRIIQLVYILITDFTDDETMDQLESESNEIDVELVTDRGLY
jgi:hypothetical protein